MFDFLVVGGGPAGAVSGMCLARAGARVAVVEATSYRSERFGETLPPEINPVLRDLHLWAPFQALSPTRAPGIVSVWGEGIPSEQDFVGNPHGDGWRIDRNAFDAMLLEEARRAGATTRTAQRANPTRSHGVWKTDEIAAPFLIDATGRSGLPLEDRNERETDDVLLAVALRFSSAAGSPADSRTYIETAPGGWWYSGLLPNGQLMAMFFTDRETYMEEGVVLGDRLAMAPLTRARLRDAHLESSRVVYVSSSCRRTLFGDGWVAAGDAASSYDPLSGQGIFKALRQGAAAARAAMRDRGAVQQYAKTVRDEFDAYVRRRRLYYAGEGRWTMSGFWGRRLQGSADSRMLTFRKP